MRVLLGGVGEVRLNEVPKSILIVRSRPRGRLDRGPEAVFAMDFSMGSKRLMGFDRYL